MVGLIDGAWAFGFNGHFYSSRDSDNKCNVTRDRLARQRDYHEAQLAAVSGTDGAARIAAERRALAHLQRSAADARAGKLY